jgi:predicted RecA/RadA family phage recombinase
MAEAVFVQKGDAIDITAGANIAAGEIVIIGGTLIGVAERAIANGDVGSVSVEGVYDVAKEAALAISLGDIVYFVAANNNVNKTSAGNTKFGMCVAAALAADTTVKVKIVR